MRACPSCGASNGLTDDFCGNCGAYLGWSDTRPAPAAPQDPEPTPPPATPEPTPPPATPGPAPTQAPTPASTPTERPAGGSRTERRQRNTEAATSPAPPAPRPAPDDIPAEPSTPATEAEPHAPAEGTRRTAADPSPTAPAPDPAPTAPAPDPSPTAPRPPAVPPTTPRAPRAPAQDPVLPVQPAKPVAPRPVVRPVAVPDEVAGTPCPSCGTPNAPGRRFCRRCATPLKTTAQAAPLPWWRTVWPLRRRVRASSGRGVRLLVILAVVAALCVGGFLLLPAGRALIEDTRDKMGKPKAITPVSVEASAEVPRHPAANTTDGLSNRYWGSPAPGASITYTFRKPFRLVDVIITNGASKSPQEYAGEARALEMDLEVTTEDGEQHHKRLTLADKPGSQTVPTGISDVTKVRLVLRTATALAPDRHVALAEVEFFERT
ncbi:zinc ribbon domain-containing protein [Streptomyces sp. NPDC018347]|uniref:NADase-type glycan-binding domain-containing protein n=1 Tax=Streptomyces sp. NPDC018347 TaxID=3157193 RepID=UPI0033D7280B